MLIRRGMSGPPTDGGRGLGAVLAPALPAIPDAGRVEGAADDVVLDRGQVLHLAAPDEHDRVLLKVVADARDVSRDLHAVGQPDAGNLAHGGRLDLGDLALSPVAHELADGRHGDAVSFRLPVRWRPVGRSVPPAPRDGEVGQGDRSRLLSWGCPWGIRW